MIALTNEIKQMTIRETTRKRKRGQNQFCVMHVTRKVTLNELSKYKEALCANEYNNAKNC